MENKTDIDIVRNSNGVRRSDTPLVSCIILLTFNDIFVKKQLIPSIITHSTRHDIEIILVYNGFRRNLREFNNIKIVRSHPLWVSKGYNEGVKHAQGEYIALFHDDCVLRDNLWMDKAMGILNEEIIAVSPEFYDYYAKCVPLIMKRSVFEDLQGFDEHYFIGNEDTDFTLKIKGCNKRVEKCDIDIIHYSGMSTILLLSRDKTLKPIFGKGKISKEEIRNLLKYYMANAYRKGAEGVVLRDVLYLKRKHKDLLFHTEQEFLNEENRITLRLSQLATVSEWNPWNRNIRKAVESLKSP